MTTADTPQQLTTNSVKLGRGILIRIQNIHYSRCARHGFQPVAKDAHTHTYMHGTTKLLRAGSGAGEKI